MAEVRLEQIGLIETAWIKGRKALHGVSSTAPCFARAANGRFGWLQRGEGIRMQTAGMGRQNYPERQTSRSFQMVLSALCWPSSEAQHCPGQLIRLEGPLLGK